MVTHPSASVDASIILCDMIAAKRAILLQFMQDAVGNSDGFIVLMTEIWSMMES